LAAGVIVAGVAGLYHLAQWWHYRDIEARIARYNIDIARECRATGLSPDFVRAVIRAESGGDPEIVSSRGAIGLMQITPPTQREVIAREGLSDGDLRDGAYNIAVGTRYLRMLLTRFDGDPWLALAAYNMGPTKLERIRQAYPDLPGKELVASHTNPTTAKYCSQILDSAGRQVVGRNGQWTTMDNG
jgi:soluble lytic murein transglycosylase